MKNNRAGLKSLGFLLAGVLLLASPAIASTQSRIQWKVGDEVEVKNSFGDWVRARIVKIEGLTSGRKLFYRVHVYDRKTTKSDWAASPEAIRAPVKEMDPDGTSA